MMLLAIFASLVVGLTSLYLWHYVIIYRIFKPTLLRIPHSLSWPWPMGDIAQFPRTGDVIWKKMQAKQKRCGPIYVIRMMWMREVHLHSPEGIKAVAQSSENITKSPFYDTLHPWLGISLLTSTGSRWKAKRRLLTPAFHFKILQNYVQVNITQTTIFLDIIAEQACKAEFIDVQNPIGQLTLDIIMRTAFDCEISAQKGDPAALQYLQNIHELSHEYFNTFHNGTMLLPYFIYSRFTPGGRNRNVEKLHSFTLNVIKDRMKKNSSGVGNSKSYQDFLQTLLESKYEDDSSLTMEDIRAEVDTFMFEGHDTTSSGIGWLLFCLAKNPDVQEKARHEVQSILGNNTTITHENLNNMKYLNAAIKEALRMYPPVPFVGRILDKAMDICGYHVPAGTPLPLVNARTDFVAFGTHVALNAMNIHYNPELWPEPEKYDPARFLAEEERAYSYIPFSAGPRNCIGQVFAMNEMKIVAAMTLKRFHLSPDRNRLPIIEPAVVLRSHNGIYLKFEKI